MNTESRLATLQQSAGRGALPQLAQRVEWLGLGLSVPAGWEIVRHSLSAEVGSLRFVDRRRERLVISWAQCKGAPDLSRLVEEMRREAEAGSGSEPFRYGPWRGIQHVKADSELGIQAVRYHAETCRLLEAHVFGIEAAAQEQSLARAILGQLRVLGSAHTSCRWRAFDLALKAPENFALVGADVAPADVRFRFEERAGAGGPRAIVATVQRLGMAESWFDGDLARLLRARLPRVQWSAGTRLSHLGVEALSAEGRPFEKRLTRLFGSPREGRALVWRATAENAVYLLTTEGPRGKAPDPSCFEVHGRAEGVPSLQPGERP
jgi:hypothetical protein